ncbi:Ataxin-3 [Entomortierella chlamydospora]|uniref:Ataxin-3 homolog n=1 Tax=Entomortierella chlamydospora TaxID=101097 RepID=A0A9P6MTG3_9FUNG|nr:Ataxin-3 [Entomortierella chlamydospora]
MISLHPSHSFIVFFYVNEQQEGNLCAQHCLNALLQGPYFTAIDLAELARQLDQREQDALGNSGSGSRNVTSQNMDDSGFFSVQVISHALSIWNTQIIPWGAKEVSDAKSEPEREFSFICNLDQHWYTLRRFGPSTQRWYDLNSLHPQPQYMSATYLGMTLSQLEAEGYSIFVVRPLSKPDPSTTSVAKTPIVSQSEIKAKEATTDLPPESTSTPSAPAPSFLNERQEMERIRRQRIEERERVGKQQMSTLTSLSASPVASDTNDSNNSNKRIRVNDTEKTEKPSEDFIVSTPSFLPPCEADGMAAAMPLVQAPESQKLENQTFGGAGYRLGGSPPQSTAASASLPPGFSLEDADLADTEDEMMQQAIAMSLQGSK